MNGSNDKVHEKENVDRQGEIESGMKPAESDKCNVETDLPMSKKQRLEISPASIPQSMSLNERCCAICMRNDGDDGVSILVNHNCPVCVNDAWNICDHCDDSLLSRLCPFCKSDYAPRILYVTPNLPKFPLKQEDLLALGVATRIVAIGKLITNSNVAVWQPEEGKMHFFLPREFTDEVACSRSIAISINLSSDYIVNDTFLFNNKIWDLLTEEMDENVNNQNDGGDDEEERVDIEVPEAVIPIDANDQIIQSPNEAVADIVTNTTDSIINVDDVSKLNSTLSTSIESESSSTTNPQLPVLSNQSTDNLISAGNENEVVEGEEEEEYVDINNQQQDDTEEDSELLSAQLIMKRIFFLLCSPNSLLLTQMQPNDWEIFDS